MKGKRYTFKTRVWRWPGPLERNTGTVSGAWHFAGVPKKESAEIRERFGASARGWGSLPVTAKIGETSWSSSIFPDKKSGMYLLPLKAAVRKREGIADKDTITLSIEIRP